MYTNEVSQVRDGYEPLGGDNSIVDTVIAQPLADGNQYSICTCEVTEIKILLNECS